MADLRGLQRDRRELGVVELGEDDDVGVLTERVTHC